MLKNSIYHYGWITILIHWLCVVVIFGQCFLGLYMLSLDYYDPLYKVLPYYHKSIGVLFGLLLLARIFWMAINTTPKAAEGVKSWVHLVARIVQILMLGMLVVIVILGYLISTAKGVDIDVFTWFVVPASITSIPNQEDWAGELHYWFALGLVVLAGVHAFAALKHHFINKDATLLRMLGNKRT